MPEFHGERQAVQEQLTRAWRTAVSYTSPVKHKANVMWGSKIYTVAVAWVPGPEQVRNQTLGRHGPIFQTAVGSKFCHISSLAGESELTDGALSPP